MTYERDIERLLDAWFDDGPTLAPNRILDVVVDRLDRQTQRPAWRLNRRRFVMNTNFKMAAVVAAVVAVVFVGYSILPGSAPNGIGGPAATASPTPSSSPSPSAAAAPSESTWDTPGDVCGLPGCAGPLTPGRYTSRGLQPAVTYTLPSRWVNVRDWEGFFMLYPDTLENRAIATAGGYPPYILILSDSIVVSPSHGCTGEAKDEVEVDSAGFVQYLAGQKNLQVSPTIRVAIDGLSGVQVDVVTRAGWTGCLPGAPAGEPLAATDGYRFIVLDRPGGKAIMIRLRTPAEFQPFVNDAMSIVNSFRFN